MAAAWTAPPTQRVLAQHLAAGHSFGEPWIAWTQDGAVPVPYAPFVDAVYRVRALVAPRSGR